jgi:hypothetical protein
MANVTNDICPPGHYCPEGSASLPVQCPPRHKGVIVEIGDCQACERLLLLSSERSGQGLICVLALHRDDLLMSE